MFTINANCYICYEKGKDKTVFLPEISGVEVTHSITSVESSEQFWRKICPIIGIIIYEPCFPESPDVYAR